MIKTLLFDNNGVITTDNEERDLAALFAVSPEEFKGPHSKIHPHYALGEITLEEYCERHRKAFSSNHSIRKIAKVHSGSYIIDPKMKTIIADLKREYEVALLTNFGSGFSTADKVWRLDEVFDKEKMFISGEIGIMKPSTQSYQYVLKELGRKPEEVVFIDDRLSNLRPAADLGIHTILFKSPEQFKDELELLVERENG